METKTDYQQQAQDFLTKTGTTFKAEFLYSGPYFDGDKDKRDVYEITLQRNGKEYIFKFGQSIANSKSGLEKKLKELDQKGFMPWSPEVRKAKAECKPPTAYDVLATLEKNDPGMFEDFCGDFGYDEDSRKAEKLYFAVQKEWKGVNRLFGDVLDALQEIA